MIIWKKKDEFRFLRLKATFNRWFFKGFVRLQFAFDKRLVETWATVLTAESLRSEFHDPY